MSRSVALRLEFERVRRVVRCHRILLEVQRRRRRHIVQYEHDNPVRHDDLRPIQREFCLKNNRRRVNSFRFVSSRQQFDFFVFFSRPSTRQTKVQFHHHRFSSQIETKLMHRGVTGLQNLGNTVSRSIDCPIEKHFHFDFAVSVL
jgi:hypothetical protein